MTFFGHKNNTLNTKYLQNERQVMLGDGLSFDLSEAYKLLRTNIMFSFPRGKEASCKVIGVTSGIRDEGKSVTSINLAFSLAMDGKNVLLIECDLRMPTISKRLMLKRSPGLSNVLVGLNSTSDAMQKYEAPNAFNIITSGDIPPNPSELLGSEQMQRLIAELRKTFDYIILDLPPVTIVADTLVISKLTDGMALVVRKDYTDRNILNTTIEQLKFVDAKILGFVFNCADDTKPRYKKYKRYYNRYGV